VPIPECRHRGSASGFIINAAGHNNQRSQSDMLAAPLSTSGSHAETTPGSTTSHEVLKRNLGNPGDAKTARIGRFVAQAVR